MTAGGLRRFRRGSSKGSSRTLALVWLLPDLIAGLPAGGGSLRLNLMTIVYTTTLALAEEHQLEAEARALAVLDIAGVVPPFGPEVRMIEVIAREGEAVPRNGFMPMKFARGCKG